MPSKLDFYIQSYFIDFPIGAHPNTRTVAPNFVLPMACSRAAGTPVQSMTKSKDSSSISCRSFGEIILNPNPKIFWFEENFNAITNNFTFQYCTLYNMKIYLVYVLFLFLIHLPPKQQHFEPLYNEEEWPRDYQLFQNQRSKPFCSFEPYFRYDSIRGECMKWVHTKHLIFMCCLVFYVK